MTYLNREQYDQVKQAACNRWPDILQSLAGLEENQVSVKVGKVGAPCPHCGGKDRYSFKDEERGGWGCRGCGGGDGFALLQKVNDWDYKRAAAEVARYLGIVDGSMNASAQAPKQPAPRASMTDQDKSQMEQAARKEAVVWEQAKAVDKSHPWVAHKRLSDQALAVCRQSGSKLLIPVFSPAGERISHQWVVQVNQGQFKKRFHYRLSVVGGLVEFGDREKATYVLVAESFADADAALQLAGGDQVAICAFSAGQVPSAVEYAASTYPDKLVVVCPDNDDAGRKAVNKAARRVDRMAVSYPPAGKDWSEHLLSGGTTSPLAVRHYMEKLERRNQESQGDSSNAQEQRHNTLILPNGNPVTLYDKELAILTAMNERYCHTKVGNKSVVALKGYCPIAGESVVFESLGEFPNSFLHLPRVASLNPGIAWINWAGKNRKLGGVTFQPNTDKCPDNVFNLWQGFNVEPVKGDCTLYLNHLEKVICAGNQEAYHYLIGWLAHMVQKPDEKPAVAVFMRSVMGAGKDTMARAFIEMMGTHAGVLNGNGQATGQFQGALQEKIFVFINEAQVTSNKDVDRLKSLITEREISLELKKRDPVRIPNYTRFIFAGNRDHVIQADPHERRYLMLEPQPLYDQRSDEHREYFKALHHWIDNGGAGHLLEYLQSYDLAGFDPHRAPITPLLIEQKEYSMKPSHCFVKEWLAGAETWEGGSDWKTQIPAGELAGKYQDWHEKNLDKKLTVTSTGKQMSGVMKELGVEKKMSVGQRYFSLPELNTIKARFARLYSATVEDLF